MARFGVEIKGFAELIAELERVGADAEQVAEKALKETQKIINKKLEPLTDKYKQTGRMQNALIKDDTVIWQGTKGTIRAGFDITNGGLQSIFLMYGTPRSTPKKDLYNAVYGKATKKEIAKAQQDVLNEAFGRLGT